MIQKIGSTYFMRHVVKKMINKKFKIIILALFIQIFTSQNAVAGSAGSCVGGINIFNTLVADVTTLGLFSLSNLYHAFVDW